MESTQRELIRVLLDRIRLRGLISDFTYSKAMDLVCSAKDFPAFFQVPVCLTKEVGGHERAQDTQ